VVLDSEVRRRAIEEQIIAAARGVDGVLRDYDDLLDEVTNLVETPVAFLGAFSAEFSGVPGAVKKAIIGKHVRCFPVYDKKGEFLPFFVGVSNGRKNALDVVKAGFERVVVARLTDARFFIERDTQRRLEEFRPGLNRLTFHEKLGTMLQKSERVVKLAEAFAAELGLAEEVRKVVSRAASLAKADLASQMVTEMTSLQGEMGAIYAARDGESAAVCQAIREHYLPRFAGDAVPQSSAGVIISLADKIDTLVAFLGIGLEPTGSADPFALRREALGVISIALNCSVATDLELMISAALNEFPAADRKAVTEKTLSFIEKRLDVVLRDRGLRHDVVRAALADHRARPRRALEVGLQIVEALTTPKFVEFLPSYLRCVRLVHKAQADSIAIPKLDETLLLEPSEKKLWEAVHGAAKLVCPDELLSTRFEKLIGLQSVITEFFDTLMVMVEDPKVRGNRLALLGAVAELLKGYGDLTALEG
jgi:tetrameric-type glycyl-tRNA synthetase beta subunit